MKKISTIILLLLMAVVAKAQIGEYRNVFALGANGGYVLSKVGFDPSVPQTYYGGITGGLTLRYTSEKYFSTICSVQAELNYASLGWTEDIKTKSGEAVINPTTGVAEEYTRKLTYVQIPIMAHLAWGKEQKGLNFFVNAGPQFGFNIGESTDMNFDLEQRNRDAETGRSTTTVEQDTLQLKHKFDYGITAGAGVEWSRPGLGHFQLEARYYYGLGNLFGSTKRDKFAKSNLGCIVIKATYLFDIVRKKK